LGFTRIWLNGHGEMRLSRPQELSKHWGSPHIST
jgi:hypothetical protein